MAARLPNIKLEKIDFQESKAQNIHISHDYNQVNFFEAGEIAKASYPRERTCPGLKENWTDWRVCGIAFEYSRYTAMLPYWTDSRYVLRIYMCVYVTLEVANGISMKAWKIFYAIKILKKASSLFEGRCVSSETKKMERVYHANILLRENEVALFPE